MKYRIQFPENYQKAKLPGRDLWCASLRSDKYKQGKGWLNKNRQYCCLGVLCVLQARPRLVPYMSYLGAAAFDECKDVLDEVNPLFEILGGGGILNGLTADTTNDDLPGGYWHAHSDLAGLNDAGLTFHQIADVIEAVWDNDEPNWELCPPELRPPLAVGVPCQAPGCLNAIVSSRESDEVCPGCGHHVAMNDRWASS